MPETPTKRVVVVSPVAPEKSAYALARYSRSPDSIVQSLEWDGQAKSSRYQNCSAGGTVAPPEVKGTEVEAVYCDAARALLKAYQGVHEQAIEYLTRSVPGRRR